VPVQAIVPSPSGASVGIRYAGGPGHDHGDPDGGRGEDANRSRRRLRSVGPAHLRPAPPVVAHETGAEQLGQVDGAPPGGVALLDLSAATEPVGQDHVRVAGLPHGG
jgi:hypothetical protein